jgi:hypothetical protein
MYQSTDAHDDLRDTLGMLAILVGSRIQRDADGRTDEDPEASNLLAAFHSDLKALFTARDKEASKRRYLAMVDALAELYRIAPTRRTDAGWERYVSDVRGILSEDEGIPPSKAERWSLTSAEVSNGHGQLTPRRHGGGPVEAARAAVADALNVSTGTLVNWRKRDHLEPPLPDQQAFFPGMRASFFGDGVDLPHAIADMIEALLLTLAPEVTPAGAELLDELRETPAYSGAADGLLETLEDDNP